MAKEGSGVDGYGASGTSGLGGMDTECSNGIDAGGNGQAKGIGEGGGDGVWVPMSGCEFGEQAEEGVSREQESIGRW
jgi:hypothetical protein